MMMIDDEDEDDYDGKKHEESEHAENMSYICVHIRCSVLAFYILRVASALLSGPGGRNLTLGMLG